MIRTSIILTFIIALCCGPLLHGLAFGEDPWTFVVVGDTRGDYETTTTGVSEYLPAIASKIASLNPSTVLVNGDLINGNDVKKLPDGDPSIPYVTQFTNWKAAMKPVYDAGIAIYPDRGNHENIASDDAAPIAALKQAYYDAFGATVPQNGPNNGPSDNQVGFSWDLKQKNIRVVTVDQYFYFHETPVGGRNYFKIDQAWVDAQLSKTAPRPYTFVMAHEPAYSLSHEEGAFFGSSAQGIADRKAFWDSLGANDSKMYLTAHVHNLQVGTAVDDSGNVIYQNMMGNGGAPLGPNDGGQDPLLSSTYSNYADYGFSLFTVTNANIIETYYLYDPVSLTWSIATYTITLLADKVCTWNTASGTFSDVSSWDPGKVPDAAYTAVFDGGAGTSSTVNFTADAENKRLFVASGSVTFNLAGNTYTADSAAIDGSEDATYCPSLAISGAGSRFNPTVLTMDGVTSSLAVGAGASATCDRITIEGGIATIGGDITASDYINLADSGPDQTLKVSSGSTITGDILSGTPGADTGGTRGKLEFKGSANVTGNIGEGGTESFKLITAGNGLVAVDGDIRATTINFAGDNDLHIGDGHAITTDAASGVTATTGGDGRLIFDGSATVNSNIGAGAWGTRIKEVNVAAPGSVVTLNGTIYSGAITVNNATATARIGSSGTSAATNFDLTAGTLDLGANTVTLGAAGAGNYTQAAGTTLKTTIQSVTVAGNMNASGATGGKCTVSGASELVIAVDPVYIPSNTTWTILDGKALSGGVVVPGTITYNSAVLSFAAAGGDDLTVTATRVNTYTNIAGDPNAAAAGSALEAAGNSGSATGDMLTVLGMLDSLSASQISAALDTVVPEVDAGVINTTTTVLDNFVGVALDRVEKVLTPAADPADSATTGVSAGEESKSSGIWGKGYGSYLTQGTLKGIAGYDAWNAGTALGVDHLFSDVVTLGISGGYAYGNVDADVNNADTYINSAQTTIYGGYSDPNLPYFIDAAGVFAYNWYNGKRDINIGNVILRTANASYDGQQYGAYLGGGYQIDVTKNIEFTPLLSLRWDHLHLGSYTETEAGSLNLSVASQDYDRLRSGAGARIAAPMQYKWGTLTPEVHGRWFYDFIGDSMVVASTFTGGGPSFNADGFKPARNSYNAGGKLTFDLKNDVSVIADCDTEMKDEFFGIYGSVTLRYNF